MTGKGGLDVLLYGLGAIGSFYAFILSRSSRVRLTVVARSNYDAVKEKGISISSDNHGRHIVRPHQVIRNAAEAGKTFDYIVCCHKAIDQEAVPAQIKAAVDENKSTIVIIQNGVGNEEPFRNAFPNTVILSCVTWVGARQPSPGIVTHTKSEDMQIGLYPNPALDDAFQQQRLNEFTSLLTDGRTIFQIVPNIQTQRWEKVVWNAAWNSLTTLTLSSAQDWLNSSSEAKPLTRRLMSEVIDVARACGVPIEYTLIDQLLNKVLTMPTIGSSMRTDCENGRPMEVDIILGTPTRKARELGVSVPTLETIYVILLGVNERLIKSQN